MNRLKSILMDNRISYGIIRSEYHLTRSIYKKIIVCLKAFVYGRKKNVNESSLWPITKYSVASISGSDKYFADVINLLRVKEPVNYHLTHLGRNLDGGYVMIDDFSQVDKVYSFGIAGDISWEKDVIRKGVSKIEGYDPTISSAPRGGRAFRFHKAGIGERDNPLNDIYTLKTFLKKNGDTMSDDMILKMDVEGAEWGFLKVTNDLGKFKQIVFELHNIPYEKSDIVLTGLKKLNKTHQVIWIHANNYGSLVSSGNIKMPTALEVTFARKSDYEFRDIHYSSPIGLDYSNDPTIMDIPLDGWGSLDQ